MKEFKEITTALNNNELIQNKILGLAKDLVKAFDKQDVKEFNKIYNKIKRLTDQKANASGKGGAKKC